MSFTQFPEQQQVVSLVQRSLERGRLAHAYLFAGNDLPELESMARTLGKALNCERSTHRSAQGLPLDSCDRCISCRKIDNDNHPDVYWIRPESKSRVITIDQMRELLHAIALKATEASYKVTIITAADRLNLQAANAFLKTLEEPPPRSIILLLSLNPEQVIETLRSRCLRLNFAGEHGPRLDGENLDWLQTFSNMAAGKQEGLLARYRLLGTLLSKLAMIKAEIEKTLAARSPLERYEDAEARVRDKWEDELAAAIEGEYRRCRAELLQILQWWLRDVWMQTLRLGSEFLAIPAFHSAAQIVGQRITTEQALQNIEAIDQTQRLLSGNVQEALALEVGLLKLKL